MHRRDLELRSRLSVRMTCYRANSEATCLCFCEKADDESRSDESISFEMPVAEGYRHVHMESLREFVERIHSASQDCASGKVM